ncbi:O-acetyl-ADP-ribose deacetylase, partial [bacterium]|nr:O-acetyl-ADP-ribose deacetylase [bacterium]
MQVNGTDIRVITGDLTDMDVEAIVFYAEDNLKLGSGFGNAVTMRGGPSIQEELKELAPLKPLHAVVSAAGNLKAKHIVHVNGPKFQERDLEGKLRTAIFNTLQAAEEKGIKHLAFPPMGAGFYG